MNATDSPQAPCPARRWRMWWLAVPAVPLSVFAAVVGYDSLQAQQPGPSQNVRPLHHQPGAMPQRVPQYGSTLQPQDPAHRLANELRRLDPQSDDYLNKRAALEKMVMEQFDQRHQQQLEMLTKSEQKLSELKRDWERRAEAKEQIVSRRINELLGERDPLRWDAEPLHMPSPYAGTPYAGTPYAGTPNAGTPYATPSGPPVRNQPAEAPQVLPPYFPGPQPGPQPPTQQAVPLTPDNGAFAPKPGPSVGSPAPAPAFRAPAIRQPAGHMPSMVQEANRVAGELARCIQQINTKQVELRRLQARYNPDAKAQNETLRLTAELTALRQQQKLMELQAEQLERQAEMQLKHARQALENAEKRLQVAHVPLDDSNPTSHRQQQRDIAEAETKLLQALQQMASVEQQGEYLQRLRDSVGKVNEQEIQQPEDAEDSADAEEAGDAVAE